MNLKDIKPFVILSAITSIGGIIIYSNPLNIYMLLYFSIYFISFIIFIRWLGSLHK